MRSTDGAGNQPHLQHGHSRASRRLPRIRVSWGCYSREGSIPWDTSACSTLEDSTDPGRRNAQSHPPSGFPHTPAQPYLSSPALLQPCLFAQSICGRWHLLRYHQLGKGSCSPSVTPVIPSFPINSPPPSPPPSQHSSLSPKLIQAVMLLGRGTKPLQGTESSWQCPLPHPL